MKNTLIQKPMLVKKSLIHGYGVFAEIDIYPNEIIEECHLIKTPNDDVDFTNYYFGVKEKNGIPLGFGCIYNHSTYNNASFYYDEKTELMIFYALRFISKGEEILVSYGSNWFGSRNAPIKESYFFYKLYPFLVKIPLRATLVLMGIFLIKYSLQWFSIVST